MKSKLMKRIVAGLGIACCSLSILATPISAPITAQAAAGNESVANPQHDVTQWYYLKEDGKLYKRLWSFTTGQWLTDWIYVRDL